MIVRQFAFIVLLIVPAAIWSEDRRPPIAPEGIPGTVILCGRECAPDVLASAVDDALNRQSARKSDRAALFVGTHPEWPRALAAVEEKHGRKFQRIHKRTVGELDEAAIKVLDDSIGLLWWHVDEVLSADSATIAWLRRTCVGVRDRGGVIILSGGAVSWFVGDQGADIIPGCRIVRASVEATDRKADGRFLLRWNAKSVVTLRGRRLLVARDAAAGVDVVLPEGASRSRRIIPLNPGDVADLTALRKGALARTHPPFPPEEPLRPDVSRGTLLLVGGGLTDEMVEMFVESAGGAEAKIVIVPTAQESPFPDPGELRRFRRAGAGEVVVLHAASREEAAAESFLQPLREATGIWFTGGRQWRLVDRYEGTPFVEACREVLNREGIIGGTSAGATILGDYLVRGNPLGNAEIMAEGYERGFALLPGAAIDQHVTERNREPQLRLLNRTWPQLLTIGLDERTALLVEGTEATVLGAGTVRLLDRQTATGSRAPMVLRSGEKVDLPDLRARARN